MNNNKKIILGIILASFTIITACSGCTVLTLTGGALGFHLGSGNKEKTSDVRKNERINEQPVKSDQSQPSRDSGESKESRESKEIDEAVKPLDNFVTAFHERFNADKFEEMYDSFDASFRQQVNKEKFVNIFSGLKDKLGEAKDVSRYDVKFGKKDSATTVTLFYKVIYSNGTIKESFSFAVVDEKIIFYSFDIDPEGNKSNSQKGESSENAEQYY